MGMDKCGLWLDNAYQPDTYVAFRGSFELADASVVNIKYACSQWCNIWLDGELIAQGPARYNRDMPEYENISADLTAGWHTIAAVVTYTGVQTRMLDNIEPFWFCQCRQAQIDWKCIELEGFEKCIRRINPQMGWIEWCDTRKLPKDWQKKDFDDSDWLEPKRLKPDNGELRELSCGSVKLINHNLEAIEQGVLADVFSYDKDDPPTRFFLRDTACRQFSPDGVWRRYDLGRVRLGVVDFELELPAGAVVEFAYAEQLYLGKVAPYINCATGLTANMDHYVAQGGLQKFSPITPKGGRFVEVHILADPEQVHFCREGYIERCYYDKPDGGFVCDDDLLNRIWDIGVETFRACSEDTIVDNPTRERGQWTGDVVSVGMEIAAATYGDMSIFKRALLQAAMSRNCDGLVAGLCPGSVTYLSSYAAQWVGACLRYYRITGDKDIIDRFWGYAVDNLAAFEKALTDKGLSRSIPWAFIDWGYEISPDKPDIAMDCHYLEALENAVEWASIIGDLLAAEKYRLLALKVREIIGKNVKDLLKTGWGDLGYHSAVLCGRMGFFEAKELEDCIGYVKNHILSCFPENPDAPRLNKPFTGKSQVITPYFSHYAFDFLINNGLMDFVLERYRNCWGWVLNQGLTTLPEVFDLRWSHCHQWSGCPTWQLSKYCLGLEHDFDCDRNSFKFVFNPVSLEYASGAVPMKNGKVSIKWHRRGSKIHYSLKTDKPITITGLPERDGVLSVENEAELEFTA